MLRETMPCTPYFFALDGNITFYFHQDEVDQILDTSVMEEYTLPQTQTTKTQACSSKEAISQQFPIEKKN